MMMSLNNSRNNYEFANETTILFQNKIFLDIAKKIDSTSAYQQII